jgi:hypothetical protein
MAVNRDQLFAELEALTEAEIGWARCRSMGRGQAPAGRTLPRSVEIDDDAVRGCHYCERGGVGGGSSREKGNLDSACSPRHRGGGNGRSDGIGVRRLPGASELDLVSANGSHQLEPQSVVGINWHQGTNLNFDL